MKSLVLETRKHKIYQIVKFGMVGAICAALDLLLFILLYEQLEVSYLLANLESTGVAILLNYYISKKWVFKSGKYNSKVEFTAFMAFSLAGLLLNQGLIWLFVEKMAIDPVIGKVVAIILVAVFNFITKKVFVFKD